MSAAEAIQIKALQERAARLGFRLEQHGKTFKLWKDGKTLGDSLLRSKAAIAQYLELAEKAEQIKEPGQPARPLDVLVPLIMEDLRAGDEAAKQAGMPHYRAAGEKLTEAKAQLPHGQFESWINRNLEISPRTARDYMALAAAHAEQNGSALPKWESIRAFHRDTRKPSEETQKPPEDFAEFQQKFKAAHNERARFQKDADARKQQRDAMFAMSERVIKAGYRELAKELHPDKGGSGDQMVLLNEARRWLEHSVRPGSRWHH